MEVSFLFDLTKVDQSRDDYKNIDILTMDSNIDDLEKQMDMLKTPKSELSRINESKNSTQNLGMGKGGTMKKLLSLEPQINQTSQNKM
jgi:hypothetical protein